MRRLLPLFAGLAVIASGSLLAGCKKGQGAAAEIVAIGSNSVAPAARGQSSLFGQLLKGATSEGLVTLDEQGQVVPGLADRWIVTDDGLSYIFRLRDGHWPDGTALTGESARAALRSAIAGQEHTGMARDLAAIDDIRVMTGRVLEVRLAHPSPEFLMLLAQPELGLVQHMRGGGPMQMKRDGAVTALTMLDPEVTGIQPGPGGHGKFRDVRLRSLAAPLAIAQFNRGEADAVLGGSLSDFPLVEGAGLSRGAIQIDPVAGLFGLAVVHDDGFLSDPANREAIAMAIDRQALIAALGLAGWTPTTRIAGAGIEDDPGGNGERWATLAMPDRQTLAASRVTRWRAGKPDPVRLRIAMPAGPGMDILFARLSADLAKAGLVADRVREGEPADLRLLDEVARYPRIGWFLNQLSCENERSLCSADADALVAQAEGAQDPATRASLLTQAESKLTEANVFIPIGPPLRWSLLRGDTTGFAVNRLGYHPLMPFALPPK